MWDDTDYEEVEHHPGHQVPHSHHPVGVPGYVQPQALQMPNRHHNPHEAMQMQMAAHHQQMTHHQHHDPTQHHHHHDPYDHGAPPMQPEKKRRRKKDPNEPKRPLTPFMWFSTTNRESIKGTLTNASFTEVAKALGEKWKMMDELAKAPYVKVAADDKKRYIRQMECYMPSDDYLMTKKQKKKRKDPDHPKKPLSAFMLFLQEHRAAIRANNPGQNVGAISKIGGEMWKTMTDEQKAPYHRRQEQEKHRYQVQMRAYKGY